MATNLFAAAAKTTTKKAPAPKKSAVEISVPGVEQFASIDAVIKALTAIKATLEGEIKAQGVAHFITDGMKIDRRPENVKATEGAAEASIQLKAKASNIAITEDDQERLAAAGIPLQTVDNVVKTFIINPEYAGNEKLLAKVSTALEKVPGLPNDFIQLQEDTKVVVDGDNTLNALFALDDRAQIEELLPLVSSIAIRASLTGGVEVALANVGEVLGLDVTAVVKADAKTAA